MDNNEKLDKIVEDVNEIKVILARNTSSLELHIKRTDLAEQNLEQLRQEVSDDLKPIKEHINMVKGAMWLLGVLGAALLGLQQLGILNKLF